MTQASLDDVFEQVGRIRVVSDRRTRVLFETDEEEEILDAYEAMTLAKGAPEHGTCPEGPRIEFIGKDGALLATLSLQHGQALCWDERDSEARLANGDMLVEWLRRRGVEARHERRSFPPTNAAVVHDPYRWIGPAQLLFLGFLCTKFGLLVIPLVLCCLAFLVLRIISGGREIGALHGWGFDVRATVSAGADGLTIDGKLRARPAELTAGFVVPDRRGPSVLLERKRWWPLMLRMRTKHEAMELLQALGLDASRKAVTRRALSGPLTIGVDGIAGTGSDGREVFFACSDVMDVSTYHTAPIRIGYKRIPAEWGVDLALRDGRSARIPVTQWEYDPLLALTEERIRECTELSSDSHVPGDEEALARRGRAGLEWLRGLRGTVLAGYRATAVDTEHLSRLLLDAQARPSARAAAALVLTSSGDAEAATKLRIAAGAIANPHVRIALENVATASDDRAVAEALEVLDEAERQETESGSPDPVRAPRPRRR